jgi:hypothetical protein
MASGASVAVTVAVLMAVAIMEVLGAIINAGGSSEMALARRGISRTAGKHVGEVQGSNQERNNFVKVDG